MFAERVYEAIDDADFVYAYGEDGIHRLKFLTTSDRAIALMGRAVTQMGDIPDVPVNRLLIDATSTSSVNVSKVFRAMRQADRDSKYRAPGRVALILRNTIFAPVINALLPTLLRNGDRFRIFSNVDEAEKWVLRND
jgi:hypothetical protein